MKPVTKIMRDVARDAGMLWRERYGAEKGLAYLFGDWPYVAETLTVWGKDAQTARLKFPCLVLYSPFTERRGGDTRAAGRIDADLQLLIMTNTRPEYDNETRERVSFDGVLRPLYQCLIAAIGRDRHIVKPYKGTPEHEYRENYRYGRSGVNAGDGKTFFDYIDAIEINRLRLTFREVCGE